MVKILNITGDIKIGTQGPAVYQRKHGVQIRRMRQPKRAIASEKQIEHRQLYTSALAWRKSLTLPQRRFLDGYAISHWIVDDHKQPLPWHRLALKLYLEHIKYTLLYKPPPAPPLPYGIYDQLSDASTSYAFAYSGKWRAQTFTPEYSYYANNIQLSLKRKLTITGPFYVRLYLADINHKPTGAPLCEISRAPSTISETEIAWYSFTFDPILLTKGQEYVIQANLIGGGGATYIIIYLRQEAPFYPRGVMLNSTDSGSTWTVDDTKDLLFRVYGQPLPQAAGAHLISVRHTALKDIEHSRNGITIAKWQNMSSFDSEQWLDYLELTADPGDIITATTLAGISKEYRPF
ncbi:MAG: hypothetical protein PHH49_08390 [Candidatus Omnitrophica bacterium]|nr:hypothetical protein [Candidatus Omnitrophota bacterium]